MMKRGEILPRIATGDPDAVAACIDEYAGMVHGLAWRYLALSIGDIDDAVQDVFVEIWRCAGRFSPGERSSEAAFVATIAHRRLIDAQRRLSSRPKPSEFVSEDGSLDTRTSSVDERAETDEKLLLATEALSQLPVPIRDVMYLSFHAGLSHARIARQVGLPIGTVKTRLRRGLRELRTKLAGRIAPNVRFSATV